MFLRFRRRLTGKIVLSNQVTFDDVKNLIVNDYRNNGRKSLPHLEQVRLPKLADVFAGMKTIDITTAVVEGYKSLRLKDGAAPATLNRELAALKRMYRLGLRHGLVATMRYISLLTEHNVRKGFFELDQFREILKNLPTEYHALFEIAYITGWRIKSELLTRQWRHVELNGNGWLRLDPGEGRNVWSGISVHEVDARGPRTAAEIRLPDRAAEAHRGPVGVLPARRRPDPQLLQRVAGGL